MSIEPIGSSYGAWQIFASHLARLKAGANAAAARINSADEHAPLLPPPPDRPAGGGVPAVPVNPVPAPGWSPIATLPVISPIPLPPGPPSGSESFVMAANPVVREEAAEEVSANPVAREETAEVIGANPVAREEVAEVIGADPVTREEAAGAATLVVSAIPWRRQ